MFFPREVCDRVNIVVPLSFAFFFLGSIVHGTKLLNRDFGVTKGQFKIWTDLWSMRQQGRAAEREKGQKKDATLSKASCFFKWRITLIAMNDMSRARSTAVTDVRTNFASLRNGNYIRNSYFPSAAVDVLGFGQGRWRWKVGSYYNARRLLKLYMSTCAMRSISEESHLRMQKEMFCQFLTVLISCTACSLRGEILCHCHHTWSFIIIECFMNLTLHIPWAWAPIQVQQLPKARVRIGISRP